MNVDYNEKLQRVEQNKSLVANFYASTFFIMTCGIVIAGLVAMIAGKLLLPLAMASHIALFFVCLLSMVASVIVQSFLFSDIEKRSTSSALFLFILSSMFVGVQLCPVYIIAELIGSAVVIQAFLGTVCLFVGLCVFVLISKKDFSNWYNILFGASICFCLLAFAKFLLYMYFPSISSEFNLLFASIGLALSAAFLIVEIDSGKKLCERLQEEKAPARVFANYSIVMASILFREFVALFTFLLQILIELKRK